MKTATRMGFGLSLTAGLAMALGLGLAALEASAGEILVEGFDRPEKFALVWPAGRLEHGEEEGFSWVRVVTDGQGGSSFASNVRSYSPAIDATGKFVKVRVKVDDVTLLSGLEFRLSSDRFGSSYFGFPVPLYDDKHFNVLSAGEWVTLTFSFGGARVVGTPERRAIDAVGFYVADRGSKAPVTAYWGGLSLVDEPREGVVSITFDDGYDEHHAAAKLMAKHGFPGTAYVIPSAVGQSGYMTLHQLVDLQERYGWDVAAHHETPFTDFSPDQLESAILGVQRYLETHEFGAGAGHLAYPLGKQDPEVVRPLVRKYFTTARVAGAGPETLPPADRHLLRVFNVLDTTTPKEIADAAKRAREHKEWLILMFHYLVDKPDSQLEYAWPHFKRALELLDRAKVRVLPVASVWDACSQHMPGVEPCSLATYPARAITPEP